MAEATAARSEIVNVADYFGVEAGPPRTYKSIRYQYIARSLIMDEEADIALLVSRTPNL